jgi:tetratricopeptide (TPR) repeat protein
MAGLRQLARSLENDGRTKDALLLFDHLAKVDPGDIDSLRELVRLFAGEGRTLDVLHTLSALKKAGTDAEALLDQIQGQIPAALKCFNDHLTAGEVEKAECYASAMVALVPRNLALLDAALSCNMVLGRKDKAAEYASTLLTLDSVHGRARSVLAECSSGTNDQGTSLRQRIALALAPANDLHPLLKLRDLHDVSGEILCAPLTDKSVQQVEQILEAARELNVGVPAGSEWEIWEKHYRLLMDAIDLPAIFEDVPKLTAEREIALMTSSGVALQWPQLLANSARLGARVIFFAAADEAYVDLYARWYVKSILKYCEVPFLIVLHVIGAAEHLRQVAKSVGIADERLIFSGDSFDAQSVATACYDTPPKGRIAKPVAHLQSIRFLRLGRLLQKMKLPVFVSDIDLLLQRGVEDLLARCKDADVVFNENTIGMNAGSRLTANLVLVNPTDNAAQFLRFLGSYLERMLGKPEVTRWIDQMGLLFARHYLALRTNTPRIEYFDTNTDINNVMYKSYREHPFRFLSLYHGFDTSSLEGNANVLGEEPKQPNAA